MQRNTILVLIVVSIAACAAAKTKTVDIKAECSFHILGKVEGTTAQFEMFVAGDKYARMDTTIPADGETPGMMSTTLVRCDGDQKKDQGCTIYNRVQVDGEGAGCTPVTYASLEETDKNVKGREYEYESSKKADCPDSSQKDCKEYCNKEGCLTLDSKDHVVRYKDTDGSSVTVIWKDDAPKASDFESICAGVQLPVADLDNLVCASSLTKASFLLMLVALAIALLF